jgi:hypothetical protein
MSGENFSFADLMAPVGPVAEAYVLDERLISGIMGPFGSAKTTMSIRKMVTSCLKQRPSPKDGVRRARWCVVRDTYSQLETNVMKSWFTWFPKEKGYWNGNERLHRVKFQVMLLDGSPPVWCELEVIFRAMGDLKAEDVLKGLELTGLWLNETDTLDRSVLTFGIGRIGRYPAAKDGGCAYRAVIADFNAPDIDNWTYDLFVEQDLPLDEAAMASLREALGERFGVGFHRQPGGMEPNAENKKNLEVGYYEQMMIGMSEHHINRFVHNKFGAVRNGQPVYPEFNDNIHVADYDLKPELNLPIFMGVDGGSTPAAVFGQRMDSGQIRVLAELVIFAPSKDDVLEKMGPETFGEECAEFYLEHFSRCPFGMAFADPATLNGDDYDASWLRRFWTAFKEKIGSVARQWRIKAAPVRGNRLPDRIEPVRKTLTTMPGGKPGLLLGKRCKVLRRGFNNGYVLVRVQRSSGGGRWKDEPEKNDFSHVHDALQYLVVGILRFWATITGGEVRDRIERKRGNSARRGNINFGSGHFVHRDR